MPEVLTVNRAARRLGVTASWLKAEATAGRLPHLLAGTRLLFDIDVLTEAVSSRIRNQAANVTSDTEGVADAE